MQQIEHTERKMRKKKMAVDDVILVPIAVDVDTDVDVATHNADNRSVKYYQMVRILTVSSKFCNSFFFISFFSFFLFFSLFFLFFSLFFSLFFFSSLHIETEHEFSEVFLFVDRIQCLGRMRHCISAKSFFIKNQQKN